MNPAHFIMFRILLGIYLLQHFALLLPYAAELFSREGLFPEAAALPAYGFFPNLLFVADSPAAAQGMLVALTVLSLALAAGCRQRICALLIYCGWAMLLSRAPFIANPSIPFIGLLLLAVAAVPADLHTPAFRAASLLLWRGIWVLMALSYTISGFHKLGSPSWVDGSAIGELATNPLARDYFLTHWIASAPALLISAMTWGALALEILFAPVSLVTRARPLLWLAMIGMHAGILMMVSFADLTCGMLLLHFFTLDQRWLAPKRARGDHMPIVFFDGECVMCNRLARLMIAIDTEARFKLAPLQGTTFSQIVAVDRQGTLPDSIVVYTDQAEILTRSAAVLYIAAMLGGFLGMLGMLLAPIPRPIRDMMYDVVARLRYRIFGRSAELCGLIPHAERHRMLP